MPRDDAQGYANAVVSPNPPIANAQRSPYPNEAYQLGWVSALPLELAAASGMLDEEHGNPQVPPPKADSNSYMLGRIHDHNVVIACLPKGEIGASSAALVARDMLSSFPNVRMGLMVGIGAGIPSAGKDADADADDDDDEPDVHLGDVFISSDKKTGGVVAYLGFLHCSCSHSAGGSWMFSSIL